MIWRRSGRFTPAGKNLQVFPSSSASLLQFQTCSVLHCKIAFACSLTHQSGWKLVFSGDTRPCDELVNLGKTPSDARSEVRSASFSRLFWRFCRKRCDAADSRGHAGGRAGAEGRGEATQVTPKLRPLVFLPSFLLKRSFSSNSTTSEAIGIGVKMNANFIMLNHFSQRYAKIPLLSKDLTNRVGISFDHMKVRLLP